MVITAKVILNFAHHGWVEENIFHSRLPKVALNGIFSIFLSYSKTSNLHHVVEEFYIKKGFC